MLNPKEVHTGVGLPEWSAGGWPQDAPVFGE